MLGIGPPGEVASTSYCRKTSDDQIASSLGLFDPRIGEFLTAQPASHIGREAVRKAIHSQVNEAWARRQLVVVGASEYELLEWTH